MKHASYNYAEKSSDFSKYKPYIEQYLNDMGCEKNRSGFYECPFCHSGRGRHQTPAFRVYPDGGFYCFSCHSHGDICDLMAQLEGMDKTDTLKRVKELYGNRDLISERKTVMQKPNECNYSEYVFECINHVEETDYFLRRGLSFEDVARFMLGYDPTTDAVVIPYGRRCSYYLKRSVKDKHFYKPPTSSAGTEPLYNAEALQKTTPCFICESPIDAISVMAVSESNAVAIGGTGIKKLIDYIDKKGVKAPIVVSLDDDEGKPSNTGLECAKNLIGELTERRVPCILARYSKEKYPSGMRKDANDMLVANREAFSEDVAINSSLVSEISRIIR